MEDERLHTDPELEREIQEQLTWDYRLETSDIQVHVTNGNAYLTGSVPSDSLRVVVTRNVSAIPGVLTVSNQLKVGQPLTETMHDDLETRLTQMLRAHTDLDVSQVEITVIEDGMVILNGETDTYWEKMKVEDIVTSFIGTVGVENRIIIEPHRTVEDTTIAREILTNILEEGVVTSLDALNIKVENGKVSISGSVPTWTAYNSVYEAAAVTYGVTKINLNIDIEETY